MYRPQHGERVIARPMNPAIPVQRGENLHGQMLAVGGQEVIWDGYLDSRFSDGVVIAEPLRKEED